jgi:hypothetical protein
MPYTLYATNRNGDGYVQHIGIFDEVEDISIQVGMFAKDVVIHVEEEHEREFTAGEENNPKLPKDWGKVNGKPF